MWTITSFLLFQVKERASLITAKAYHSDKIRFAQWRFNLAVCCVSLIRLAISEMIHYCGIFALDRFEIGVQNSGHPLNHSDAKLKPIVT